MAVGSTGSKLDSCEALRQGLAAFEVGQGAVGSDVGIDCGAFSSGVKVSAQAARSMGGSVGFSASVGHPSTFLIVIWPEARSAQNSIAAVSAEGRTVWVLIRRLNSS